MKRNFWFGTALGALVVAALAPWSASQAGGVSVRVNTPEFGIRIGAPPVYRPAPVYHPVPVYGPPPVVYAPAPRYVAPPVVVYGYPYHYWRHHHWRHNHWRHHQWRHHRHHGDDDHRRHWR